ncbi:hypothetical protein DFH07DRAFT_945457 [Mycena maculata]|uniref:Uncharacterized protein n=1 Tax=Mycena maculata TaxID=230809 RepID=A0AAD7MS41_9AGAR|nr:hypothetical protein DFH07DRAFT_945457 [Mycena maculata]
MSTDVVGLKRRNRNITLYVGGDNEWNGRLFCFERGSQSLVIQTPQFKLPGYTHFNSDPDADTQYVSTFFFDLEKIATLVKSMVFGETNWAYLITHKDGSYRLHYKDKPIPPIVCPPWAPLVPETDIVYTRYVHAAEREAVWNGRAVDCLVGWNDLWRSIVDRSMEGHRLLKGLDVTVEVLGHIVRNDEIIGIMTEHTVDDRLVEYRDRAAVYAAVKRVQSKSLIIRGLHESSITIHRGKVRFLDTQSIQKFSAFADTEAATEKYHWQTLAFLFDDLREHPNFMPLMRCIQNEPIPMIPIPSPEKPLDTELNCVFRMIVHRTAQDQQVGWGACSKSALATLLYNVKNGLCTALFSLSRCTTQYRDDDFDLRKSSKPSWKARNKSFEAALDFTFSSRHLRSARPRHLVSVHPYNRPRLLTFPE